MEIDIIAHDQRSPTQGRHLKSTVTAQPGGPRRMLTLLPRSWAQQRQLAQVA
jgi:hypothetical protein